MDNAVDILVGNTGFVGSNLVRQHSFDAVFNSKTIQNAYDLCPDLCVYAGIRAEKYLANQAPDKDFAHINQAIENIKRINPKKIVLISTIDVFKEAFGVNESTAIKTEGLLPYGLNRYYLEQWVSSNIENSHIVRLPGLFGKNIKKNFLYDLLNIIPQMLSTSKYEELVDKDPTFAKYYSPVQKGFYQVSYQNKDEEAELKGIFEEVGFSALNFTDSRAYYQFYDLKYLWMHLEIVLKKGIKLVHLAVEPLNTSTIYQRVRGKDFINHLGPNIPKYDFQTLHAELFNGVKGYIFDQTQVLADIVEFMEEKTQ